MAITLFSRDIRRTDSYADTTVQICGYHITAEFDQIVGDGKQFPVVIQQSIEVNSCDRIAIAIPIFNLHSQASLDEVCHVYS
jgi:hypothetical protein